MSMLALAPPPVLSPPRARSRPAAVSEVRHLRRLQLELDGTCVHYVVRPGLDPAILTALVCAGARFVVGSAAAVAACLAAGAPPGHLVFGTAAPRRELAAAAAVGVRTFIVDTPGAVADLGLTVPGAAVLARIEVPSPESSYPRPRGPAPGLALGLLNQAAASGLDPAGFSLPSVTRASSGRSWRRALGASAYLSTRLRAAGHRPWLLDLGAGYPRPIGGASTPGTGCDAPVHRQLREVFGAHQPSTMASFSHG